MTSVPLGALLVAGVLDADVDDDDDDDEEELQAATAAASSAAAPTTIMRLIPVVLH